MLNIKKVQIRGDRGLNVTYFNNVGDNVNLKGVGKAHKDFIEQMLRLTPYLAELTEQREADSIDWDDIESEDNKLLLKKIVPHTIIISGRVGSLKVTIHGSRMLARYDNINIVSPTIDLEEGVNYDRAYDLYDIVRSILEETNSYVLEGKFEEVQKVIDFDDPFEEGEAGESQPLA